MRNNGLTFLYHAHGTALGGVIRRPFTHSIESQASASLPISGGYGSARATDFKFQELVSFSAAYTQLSGSWNEKDGSHNTMVSTVIEDLNIDHMVTADRVVARLTTVHTPGKPPKETRVLPAGSHFVNLRIAGRPIEPQLDTGLFSEVDTVEEFKKRYQDSEFKKEMHARFLWGDVHKGVPDFLQERYKWHTNTKVPPESKGIIPCSLAASIQHKAPELKVYGNVIVVPEFGVIYLAEYYLKESARRLTMLRLELGSPFEGDISVCGVDGNGTSYP